MGDNDISLAQRIYEKLAERCHLDRSPSQDSTSSLDFIVNKFNQIDKYALIGVRVVSTDDDPEIRAAFVEERKKKRLVDRSVFVEIASEAVSEEYAAEMVYAALVDFAFRRDQKGKEIVGVRVNNDVTFEFFNLSYAAQPAYVAPTAQPAQREYNREPSAPREPREQQPMVASSREQGGEVGIEDENDIFNRKLQGVITRYFDGNENTEGSGFGFVKTNMGNGEEKKFFFHISQCDEALKTKLIGGGGINHEDTNLRTGPELTVEFLNSGRTKKNAKYPTAADLKLKHSDAVAKSFSPWRMFGYKRTGKIF